MKKISILILMLLFATNMAFADAPSGWAKNEIDQLQQSGWVKDTLFNVYQDPISRQDFVYLAVTLYEKLTKTTVNLDGSTSFDDTDDPYVLKAAQLGITKGLKDRLFGPNVTIDRQQLATFLMRTVILAKQTVKETQYIPFSDDTKIQSWAKSAVYQATVNGIMNGMGRNEFNPSAPASREMAMVLVKRVLDKGGIVIPQQAITPKPKLGLSSEVLQAMKIKVVAIEATGYDKSTWTGTGYFISADGNLVTNYHVVEGSKSLKITMSNGKVYDSNISVMGYDGITDVCILDIDATNLAYFSIASADTVKEGMKVFTIGNPIGLNYTIADGLLSAIRDGYYQVSVPISSGSSGSPIFNENGDVISTIVGMYKSGTQLGISTPSSDLSKIKINRQGLQQAIKPLAPEVEIDNLEDNKFKITLDYKINHQKYTLYRITENADKSELATAVASYPAVGSGKYAYVNITLPQAEVEATHEYNLTTTIDGVESEMSSPFFLTSMNSIDEFTDIFRTMNTALSVSLFKMTTQEAEDDFKKTVKVYDVKDKGNDYIQIDLTVYAHQLEDFKEMHKSGNVEEFESFYHHLFVILQLYSNRNLAVDFYYIDTNVIKDIQFASPSIYDEEVYTAGTVPGRFNIKYPLLSMYFTRSDLKDPYIEWDELFDIYK